jgi:hypothetical protein
MVKLNQAALDHAEALVHEGKFVDDERDDWSEHQPSAADENDFVEKNGWAAYGLWHLGVDDDETPDTKAYYKFPYGDFKKVHRCALLAAESRAGQYKYLDVEHAAAHLDEMLEGVAARS